MRQLIFTLVPAVLVLAVILFLNINFDMNMSDLTRDVTTIAEIHPLSGLLSNLGILLWCSSATVCFFVASVLHKTKITEQFYFFLSAAFLSTYLMLDDGFLLHEYFIPIYFNFDQKYVMALLALSIIAFLLSFRRVILSTKYSLLIISLGFMFLSIVIDVLPGQWFGWSPDVVFFLEDGAKWLGICFWCGYFVFTAYSFVVKANKID